MFRTNIDMRDPHPLKIDFAAFAHQWCADWNSHDVENVLAHFHDDAIFGSPLAEQLFPDCGGIVVGKDALRAYWSQALRRTPDLHFTIEAIFAGVETLVIQYRNQNGAKVSEILHFAGGHVIRGDGAYEITPDERRTDQTRT